MYFQYIPLEETMISNIKVVPPGYFFTVENGKLDMKKYYNITVTEYINSLRLNYAANLLVNTNYSLTDIYLECGFSNQTYFSTCFKRTYGMTPTAYRKK